MGFVFLHSPLYDYLLPLNIEYGKLPIYPLPILTGNLNDDSVPQPEADDKDMLLVYGNLDINSASFINIAYLLVPKQFLREHVLFACSGGISQVRLSRVYF